MRDWVGREFHSSRFPAYFGPLNSRQPVIVNDTRTSRLTTMFAGDPEWSHVRSLLDVPVLVEGEVARCPVPAPPRDALLGRGRRQLRQHDRADARARHRGGPAPGSGDPHRASRVVRPADGAAEPQPAARDDAGHDHDGRQPQAAHGGHADRPGSLQGRQRHARPSGRRRAHQGGRRAAARRRSAAAAWWRGSAATSSWFCSASSCIARRSRCSRRASRRRCTGRTSCRTSTRRSRRRSASRSFRSTGAT